MKTLILALLTIYHTFVSPLLRQLLGTSQHCRYTITCSVYAKMAIQKYGIIRGGHKAFIRLLHCQPFISYAHL